MRKKSTRVTALALAALLAVSPAASASQALGTEIHLGQTYLAEGVSYTRQHLWSATYSDLRTERYIEYTPGKTVQPVVAYGNTILEKNTLAELAEQLEEDDLRVVGGLNGDYFVVATGAPLGMVVTDGVLRSSSSYHYALGFDEDGNAFIGKPELSITATFDDTTCPVAGGLNKVRTETGGLVLYSEDFHSTTHQSSPGVDVILTPSTKKLGRNVEVELELDKHFTTESASISEEDMDDITGSADLDAKKVKQRSKTKKTISETLVRSDVPKIGSHISCTVEAVLHSEKAIEIPEGSLILSVNNNSDPWLVDRLSSLQEGDSVDIDIFADDDQWTEAVSAVGALYKMVTGGVAEPDLETAQAPRSAVGIRPDGSTVFYTVDGRQSGYSVGASMQQVAERLIELGCTEAVCMDGGGSTTLGASLPGEDAFQVLNQPSDGAPRKVSNALFLAAEQGRVSKAKHLVVTPGDAIMLSGAQLELSAISVDKLGQEVDWYDGDELDFDLPEEAGYVDDGILTAGTESGTYTLEASAKRLDGTAQITVVSKPSKLTVHREGSDLALTTLHLEPGEMIDLDAGAFYRNLPLICQQDSFTWEISEDVGTIDEDGVLTASPVNSTGTVTVSAGGRSQTIPVTVSGHILTVEDFEDSFFDSEHDALSAQVEPESRSAYVRYGKQSARISYDLTGEDYGALRTDLDFEKGEKYLSFWVYGDGSGNTLSALLSLKGGDYAEQILSVLNFTGWQQITATLPTETHQLTALKLDPTGTVPQGSFWLDQITSSNQFVPDNDTPDITVELIGTSLTANLQDNMDESFSKAQISVTYDGLPIAFQLDGMELRAELPESDGLTHRVTVTATDASGNIGRASLDVAPTTEPERYFADMDGHWASSYVNYLREQGITNGTPVGEEFHFQPGKDITRGEFALMVSRWLRLDLEAYADVQLPFADLAEIPAWCLDGVKAMYALNVMLGSAENGRTYAFASKSITHAEALTMLGRILPKGYAQADLLFADTDAIPAWAAEYVAVLVALGAISSGPDISLAPGVNITRAEVATILYKMR